MVNGSIFLDTEVLRVGNSSPGGAGKMQAYNLQHCHGGTPQMVFPGKKPIKTDDPGVPPSWDSVPRGSLNCSFRRKDKVGVPLSPLVLGLGDGAMAFEQVQELRLFCIEFLQTPNHQPAEPQKKMFKCVQWYIIYCICWSHGKLHHDVATLTAGLPFERYQAGTLSQKMKGYVKQKQKHTHTHIHT